MDLKCERSSGIFMPIASLPGPYGLGTMGQEARDFLGALADCRQSWWQVLPLNPLGRGHSPYSSDSAFALEPLYTNFDLLVQWGLLKEDDLIPFQRPSTSACDFDRAKNHGLALLKKAFQAMQRDAVAQYSSDEAESSNVHPEIHAQFADFCNTHAYWLEAFTAFQVYSEKFGSRAWQNWPAQFKHFDPEQIHQFRQQNPDTFSLVEFEQFCAYASWDILRTFANEHSIRIIGDIPIYVDLESADVWSHQHGFQLNADGFPDRVSGVPPDKMSDEGQKWNHPLYNWTLMKEDHYRYWTQKLSHLLEIYDLIRLDHFIGFERFFSIPANDKNAVRGVWEPGPGVDFFQSMKRQLGSLPFIAEDLGDVSPEVHQLRDHFKLPGMGVFVFGFDPKDGIHHPDKVRESLIYYSSTHDTQTLGEWVMNTREQTNVDTREQWSLFSRRFGDLSETPTDQSHWTIIAAIQGTKARTTIFPLADLLGLGAEGRLNRPGSLCGNWSYRFGKDQINEALSQKFCNLTSINYRASKQD